MGESWRDPEKGAVVIRNPDGNGTTFVPDKGIDYYLRAHSLMRTLSATTTGASIEFTYDELILLYLGLVEAKEALSAAEFRARVGRTESAAKLLIEALKPVIVDLERARGDTDC